jgi:hypothetical protein
VTTALIVTMPRSGSSLLSGVLHSLGVHMGEPADLSMGTHLNRYGCYEDQEFQRISLNILFEAGLLLDLSRRLAIDEPRLARAVARHLPRIHRFVASHTQATWGFKDPGLVYLLPHLHDCFPEPRYLHLHRDTGATARSLHRSMRPAYWRGEMREKFPLFSPLNRLRLILRAARLLVSRRASYTDGDFFERVVRSGHARARAFLAGRPHLEVALDDLVQRPEQTIEALIRHLGICPTDDQVERALAFVHPELLSSQQGS